MSYKQFKEETTERIISEVKEIIEAENLLIPNRTRHIAHQRFFLMFFLRKNTILTFSDIGDLFKKDHASVMHGVRYHNESEEINDTLYKTNVEGVKEYLKMTFPEAKF